MKAAAPMASCGTPWRTFEPALAEREGFEPPIRLPVCRISSAVHSTTLPPLHQGRVRGNPRGASGVLSEGRRLKQGLDEGAFRIDTNLRVHERDRGKVRSFLGSRFSAWQR